MTKENNSPKTPLSAKNSGFTQESNRPKEEFEEEREIKEAEELNREADEIINRAIPLFT